MTGLAWIRVRDSESGQSALTRRLVGAMPLRERPSSASGSALSMGEGGRGEREGGREEREREGEKREKEGEKRWDAEPVRVCMDAVRGMRSEAAAEKRQGRAARAARRQCPRPRHVLFTIPWKADFL